MNQPTGESIWGNINTAFEIALNIYAIVAKDENGLEHEGIMVPKSKAKEVLSPKAMSMAEQDGDWLCYGEDTKDIPMYEMLQRRVAACKRMETKAIDMMAELRRDGKLSLTDYFGECAPPKQTENGADQLHQVRNGIYLVHSGGEDYFAVHESVADNFMSDVAEAFGRRDGEYLYYDLTTAAVPLFELRQIYGEVNDLVVSEDSLLSTLNSNFKLYVSYYNELVQEEAKIPPVEAPIGLFLQKQLDRAAQEPESRSREEPVAERSVP
ncbi:hypothetical protein [Caproicibacter fermentans]|uniref:Uncharacterized protein n=1 Tax=Caproicibacter fermentans TaxID=2576756 RepID=A0A7G8TF27_9FIRM|nr:hypothetical protein [Caproicibacter fermentans]QNK42218.1 hypothetical protein HCR03_08425 [Caproicibacter fermentans]